MDDILPLINDQRGGIRETEKDEEESDEENTTITLDDNEVLDLPNLPFTVQ